MMKRDTFTLIFIPVLDKGMDSSRPTFGRPITVDIFEVLLTVDYNSEDEVWQFSPGTFVTCRATM